MKKGFPDLLIGGGTNHNFAESNRSGLDSSDLDFVSYSINPKVHAEDNETLIENMQAQADTVMSAKQLFGKLIYVSPVTLKMRQNTDATDKTTAAEIEPDNRQQTMFGAAWTLGSLKNLIESGAESITYYEAVGLKGILDFQKDKTLLFPLAYVLELVLNKQFTHTIKSHCSHPFEVTSLILANDIQQKIIIANHTDENLDISIFISNVINVDTLTDKGFERLSNDCFLDNSLQIASNQILAITSYLPQEE